MPIYSKKGDLGETGFLDGKRVSKNDPSVEAVGSVDEVNTQIGLAIAQIQDRKRGKGKWKKDTASKLIQIQNDLFMIGSLIAGYEPSPERIAVSKQRLEDHILDMEKDIDVMWGKLPELANFILPGGSVAGAQLHVARTVSRRAERRTIKAIKVIKTVKTRTTVMKYLNRLSDYLFCLARWVNSKSGEEETVWRNR